MEATKLVKPQPMDQKEDKKASAPVKEAKSSSSSTSSQSAINLENILLVEDKLWTLLEVHRFLENFKGGESGQKT